VSVVENENEDPRGKGHEDNYCLEV
jgi:hypothetical protein